VRVTTFLQDLYGGGAERVAISLLNAMADEHHMTLVLVRPEGDYLEDIDDRVRVVDLGGGSTARSISRLARFLRSERSEILISHLTHVNVAAALSVLLARSQVRHVAVEHNKMDLNYPRLAKRSVRLAYRAVRWVYPTIDAVVSVSKGVQDSMRAFAGIGPRNLHVIANPVVTPQLRERLRDAPAHPWLRDGGPPVLLGCGRLVEQKDFGTLIDAFARVRRTRDCRLLILGEGERRAPLQAQIDAAGLGKVAQLPGFDRNPYAAMRAADLFVLSSRWEGLPTVLIEALASGVNVVSTDCPSGPREVLDNGRYGALVPVGDAAALADAIIAALDAPHPAETLKGRAEHYSLEAAVANYERLFSSLR